MPPVKRQRKFGWVLERQAALRIVERAECGMGWHARIAGTLVGRLQDRLPFGVDCKEDGGEFVFCLKPNLTVKEMMVVCRFMGKASGAPVDVY